MGIKNGKRDREPGIGDGKMCMEEKAYEKVKLKGWVEWSG